MFLNIITGDGLFSVIILILVMLIIYFLIKVTDDKKSIHNLEIENIRNIGNTKENVAQLQGIINEKDTMIAKIIADMKGDAQDNALLMFDKWKTSELEKYVKAIDEAGKKKAEALLTQWKIEYEDKIRKDAANRSVRNVMGKVAEHLVPFSDAMSDFNPKDMRFIGSPIDLIIFDGAEELNRDRMTIYLVEVKTGTSSLSKRQKLIRDAVEAKRIKWLSVNLSDFGDDVNNALFDQTLG